MTPPPTPDPAAGTGHPAAAGPTAATRYLCAAAHLDESFWRAGLREVYYRRHRVSAPSYGFELVPVLWHCLRARNVVIARDAGIAGILLAAACLTMPSLLWLAPVAAWIGAVVALSRVIENASRRLGGSFALTPLAKEFGRLLAVIAGGTALTLFLTFVVWTSLPAMIARAFNPGARLLASSTVTVCLATCLLVALPVMGHRLWQQRQLARLVPGGRFRRPEPSPRLAEIRCQQQGNTVIYAGRNPFIGSGTLIQEGRLAGRLVRASADRHGPGPHQPPEEFDKLPFTTADLIHHVARQVRGAATDPDPERRIPDLRVENRVFLAGAEARTFSTVTGDEELAEIIRCPTEPARHYLACQVVSWRDGELVTSVYVHFAIQGQSLYLDMVTTALPPCDRRYRIVDFVDGTGLVATARALGGSIREYPRTVFTAPIRLVLSLTDLLTDSITRTAGIPSSLARAYDCGAQFSVREEGAAQWTRDSLQTQDIRKYALVIQRRVVSIVLDFLQRHGVDTAELVEHANIYFNYFTAGAMQFGKDSKIEAGVISVPPPPPAAGLAPPVGVAE